MDRPTEVAITLIRMALALLDEAERPDGAARVQHAIDLSHDVTDPTVSKPSAKGQAA